MSSGDDIWGYFVTGVGFCPGPEQVAAAALLEADQRNWAKFIRMITHFAKMSVCSVSPDGTCTSIRPKKLSCPTVRNTET